MAADKPPRQELPPGQPLEIRCASCGNHVTYQGVFSLWWDWRTESWLISGAMCGPCLHRERLAGVPQATLGAGGARLGAHGRERYVAGKLDVRVSQSQFDNVALVRAVLPDGKRTGYAEAVVRRIELRRPGLEGPEQLARPMKLILWLETSDFFPSDEPAGGA